MKRLAFATIEKYFIYDTEEEMKKDIDKMKDKYSVDMYVMDKGKTQDGWVAIIRFKYRNYPTGW